MDAIPFDAYLATLTPESQPTVSLSTVSHLQLAHVCTFAFQSLSTLLQQNIQLDADSLYQKIVLKREGGFCFELNGLFLLLLQHLGFEARAITGRIIQDNQPDISHTRTHMAILLHLEEQDYLVDVGFGGLVPTAPLLLSETSAQATPHGQYRLQQQDGNYILSTQVAEEWRMLYAFDLQKVWHVDLEMGSWFVSTHPDSPFLTRLMAARTEPAGIRHTLLNTRYSIHTQGQNSEQHELHNADEVLQLLQQVFKIQLPNSAQVHDSVQKFLNQLPTPQE